MTHAPQTTDSPDPYEAVLYPGHPFAQTHPDRLFLMAVLHGLDPAPPEGCRVLEIGCGDGLNLAAIAAGTPGLHGIGIDRAAAPLERGRRYAEALELDVEFRTLDLLDAAEAELGTFDYVVAHGVYAWVPAPVRDALLALAGRVLAPDGVAFVSYNALPGGHVRRAMRDLLRFHAAPAGTSSEAAARARQISSFAQRWEDRTDPFGVALMHELKRVGRLSDHSLIHDDLGEVWEPISLTGFVAHAGAHGLRYLADAERHELRLDRFPAGVEEGIRELAPDDAVAREQYGDYISGRAFRQSLLCRADASPAAEPVASGIERLHIASKHTPDPLGDGSYASNLDAACARLAARHPATMRLSELSAETGIAPAELAEAMLAGMRRDLVELRARPPRYATTVPERPAATKLSRLMALEGTAVATLDHEAYMAGDAFRARVIVLCDGRRDRAALVDGLLESIGRELVIEVEGEAIVDPEELREPFAARLDEVLPELVAAQLILRQA